MYPTASLTSHTLAFDALLHRHRCSADYLIADEVYRAAAAVDNHKTIPGLVQCESAKRNTHQKRNWKTSSP